MSEYRLIRDEVSPALLHIPTQTFQRIPDGRDSFFVNGRQFAFSDYISDLKAPGIVPVWCEKTGTKGKRDFATVLSGNDHYTFFNIEKISSYWEKNTIEKMSPGMAYFVFFEPEQRAGNGYLLKSTILIGDPKLSAGVRENIL